MAGIVLLAASVIVTWRDLATPDPVADPAHPQRKPCRTQWLTALMFPILTLLVLGIDVIFRLAL